jgi:hypothetical protein
MKFDTIGIMSHHGPYGSHNHNETDRAILWENLDVASAQVAIDKSWAANKDLPQTDDFVWDKRKSIFSIRGYHGFHCLVSVKLILIL